MSNKIKEKINGMPNVKKKKKKKLNPNQNFISNFSSVWINLVSLVGSVTK
jgi:hypothetical protein